MTNAEADYWIAAFAAKGMHPIADTGQTPQPCGAIGGEGERRTVKECLTVETEQKKEVAMKAKSFGLAACKDCDVSFIKNGPTQKYCESCSDKRDMERKKIWARNNQQDAECARKWQKGKISRTIANGIARSEGTEENLSWSVEPVGLLWLARFHVPFSYRLSKNSIYTNVAIGHVALRRESRSIRDLIEFKTREVSQKHNVVQGKVWIDLLVQKPNHRGDAINVVDLVCDGIKRGLGVDDRWFCIRRLDWQIVKTEPQLIIGIGQSSNINMQPCSHCGIIQPYENFNKKKRMKTG